MEGKYLGKRDVSDSTRQQAETRYHVNRHYLSFSS